MSFNVSVFVAAWRSLRTSSSSEAARLSSSLASLVKSDGPNASTIWVRFSGFISRPWLRSLAGIGGSGHMSIFSKLLMGFGTIVAMPSLQTILIYLFLALGCFGAGVLVEAHWSERLLVTSAQKQRDQAIAALTAKINTERDAAMADAQTRAVREQTLQGQVDELLKGAESHATKTIVIPLDLVRAIDAAGGVRQPSRKRRPLLSPF